jgi:hypothetical protein
MNGMGEVVLLWLFAAAGIGVMLIAVVLALGVVFGVVWLVWKVLLAAADVMIFLLGGRSVKEVKTDVIPVYPAVDAPVSGRVRQAGPGRLVRVQAGLVPPSPCLAQRGLVGLERPRRARARRRDD